MPQVQTYVNPNADKGGHCWQLEVDGQIVAVGPMWYQSEGDMRAALDKAKRALADAPVAERGY